MAVEVVHTVDTTTNGRRANRSAARRAKTGRMADADATVAKVDRDAALASELFEWVGVYFTCSGCDSSEDDQGGESTFGGHVDVSLRSGECFQRVLLSCF